MPTAPCGVVMRRVGNSEGRAASTPPRKSRRNLHF
jgi:hypothetical protein